MQGKTLKSTLSIKGKGIHTGEEARVTIHPSTSGKIEFKRNGVIIPATNRPIPYTIWTQKTLNNQIRGFSNPGTTL